MPARQKGDSNRVLRRELASIVKRLERAEKKIDDLKLLKSRLEDIVKIDS